MQLAVCPGSYDPLHNGHVEVIARAANLFDEVVVAVSANMHKTPLFPLEERMAMARETFSYLRGVSVKPLDTGRLLTDFCKEVGASAVLKGLRGAHDVPYEVSMSTMNRHLAGVETVFLTADGRHSHLSSTLVKEVHSLGGDVSEFVPHSVHRRLTEHRHSQ
ncbi:pantetheine-phosphate adenylyltransferase [Garicola koreensis]|uniref:Phosphopantetheine adenylyltransferase n=1 Tax=Garicola koreensis TaxID=1262554 RepID=A0A7W5TSU3_9MICC|nr:pantetheine-phosphate adenylyltransferase [Garicola koreensis]MBB3666808.1 pantetheine-phosphate adenylyltransferase [Garicola koreensis]